ncbi:hypothetical protein AN403_4679 [Pseudomonas fluorescens]|uniref:Uncharacterized protein n=1 Tax=Pseudomonas fluorescens TaxID=294 RepID=A0A0P8Z5W0_PSEFL|nr:hypothetical protein AN403_4679 [Pseudomonas fluorescens]
MATGDHNLIVSGLWLDGSDLHFSFGLRPVSRRPKRCPRSLDASKDASVLPSVRSGLFSRGHLCFMDLCFIDLLILPLLYCNQALCGLGWGIRNPGLPGRLDQLEVAVA